MALGNFLAELKRRHVYRAAAAYAIATFAVLEVVSNVAPILDLPGWIGRAVVLLLIAGFPVTLLAAWMMESKAPDAAPATAKVDYVLTGAVIAMLGFMVYERFAPRQETAPPVTATGTAPTEGISIAVLPFLNLSSDKEQEFFSDGMTEEITSALALVKGLRVVGRTSAFEFKGQNKDLRAIGQALGVNNLLEGSVRKAGNRVRITGQLIRANDGSHIWTKDYEGDLTDVFKTQDDIAQAIAAALQVPLGLKPDEAIIASRTADAEVHEQYLRAKAMYRARVNTAMDAPRVIEAAEAVVARSPDYARAWALLAMANTGYVASAIPQDELRSVADKFLPKAEAAGRRALALDPHSADSYAGLAFALQSRGKFQEAEDLFKKGLAIDPYNPDLLHYYASALQFEGRLKEALAIRRQLLALDPLFIASNDWASNLLFDLGQYEDSIALAKKAVPLERNGRLNLLLANYAALGRRDDAVEAILQVPASQAPPAEAAAAVRLLREPPTAAAPRDLPAFSVMIAMYHFIAPERIFDIRLQASEAEIAAGFHFPRLGWSPLFAPMRKAERFKTLLRNAGLVDYWRARGWPDVCRPVGKDDFECS